MSKEIQDFFSTYTDFVTKVTSKPSIDLNSLKNSFDDIESGSSIKTPLLLTAALGLGSETGEFVEIVKKMFLQGKPPSKDNIFLRPFSRKLTFFAEVCTNLFFAPNCPFAFRSVNEFSFC